MSKPNGNGNQAKIYAFLGSTGCGKTHAMMKRLQRPKRRRVIVWSPKEAIDNYAAFFPGAVVTSSAAKALEIVQRAGRGPFAIVFKPHRTRKLAEKQFDLVCRLYVAREITYIAEELHTVTRPSWAPDGWSELVMMGRGYGTEIFGCSQRPASMDKDFLGNCSSVRVGYLSYHEDRKSLAKSLDVPIEDLNALAGFQFIEKNMSTREVSRG